MSTPENCEFSDCNQARGHPGAHGYSPAPGLVFAPHGGGEGRLGPWEVTTLGCNCACTGVMVLRRFSNGGGEFACPRCGQRVFLGPNETMQQRILPRLYPTGMKESSRLYREGVEYALEQWRWRTEAMHLCGLIDEVQRQTRMLKADNEFKEWSVAHPVPSRWYPRVPQILKRR